MTTTTTAPALHIERRFTRPDENPFDSIDTELRHAHIARPDGSVVFDMEQVEVPVGWEQTTVDVFADKYLRKAGVPQYPIVDGRYALDGEPLTGDDGQPLLGPERSVRQTMGRLVLAWRTWGRRGGYFASADDEEAFAAEVGAMLLRQMAAPNSPQWFNTGLYEAYGIAGEPEGNSYLDPDSGQVRQSATRHERSAASACFINSIADELVGQPGATHDPSITGFLATEARLFKSGAGSGANVSAIRGEGEPLSGGGRSSGLMSFLKIPDVSAGSIKSGGTTRRAAKMVVCDIDHPDIEAFIACKVVEEEKALALINAGYDPRYDGEAYSSVAFQNANHSVRLTGPFMQALADDGEFALTARTSGETVKTVPAAELWQQIAQAAWRSADPGVQFDDLANAWHTAPADGRQRASNPCSEYLYLDDTACNLASLNVAAFVDADGRFDTEGFRHAARLWTVVLEITVAMSHYPTARVAQRSYEHRTLGLGYCNIGALLMRAGLAYDSDAGRAAMAAITALMHFSAVEASAEMAGAVGPAPAYPRNADSVARVLRNHARAAHPSFRDPAAGLGDYEHLPVAPQPIDHAALDGSPFAHLSEAVWRSAEDALVGADTNGLRNMQLTVLAPTGTISFIMGADTTGVEPTLSLKAYKKLAGGGTLVLVNRSVAQALESLGYHADDRDDILAYIEEHNTVVGAPALDPADYPVFDCALGDRSLSPQAHVRALGAVAPFLSGSASKTVNMPAESTVDDVADIYRLAYVLGVKCVAVYRDGSKYSQPMTTSDDEQTSGQEPAAVRSPEAGESPTAFYAGGRPPKFRLPAERTGLTRKANVGGFEVITRTGEYPDGTLGEVFIDLGRDGSTLKGVLSDFSISVSKQLQAGVPLDDLVATHTNRIYEPRGIVEGDPNVAMATSIIDYVFRWLAHSYLGDTELVQRPFGADHPRGPLSRPHPDDLQRNGGEPERTAAVEPAAVHSNGHQATPPADLTPTGNLCGECGGVLKMSGSCQVCLSCGVTTGCS